MPYLRRLMSLVVLAAVGGGYSAQAVLPATPEQILCGSTYVFVGRVLTAPSTDCRVKFSDPPCSPPNSWHVKVRVDEIMGAQGAEAKYPPARALWPGEVIDVLLLGRNKVFLPGEIVLTEPSDSISPNDWLKAAFANRDFLFSLIMTNYDLNRDALEVAVWPLSKKDWARETMVQSQSRRWDCPRPK
jgi:hypothetical protein